MSLAAVLTAILDVLERAGVPHMLTGSLASAFHGEPRATRDINIVIDPDAASLERLVDLLRSGDFYVDRDAAEEALRDGASSTRSARTRRRSTSSFAAIGRSRSRSSAGGSACRSSGQAPTSRRPRT